jgi:hypothetical protein
MGALHSAGEFDLSNSVAFHDDVEKAIRSARLFVRREVVVPDRGDGESGRIDLLITDAPEVAIELDWRTPRGGSLLKLDRFAGLKAPFRFHDCRHHFASWFMMRGGSLPALQKILGHASLAMTMRYAHLSPEHLRGEMAKTEQSVAVEPDAGTRVGQRGQNAPEVVEFTDERRGSSVAEQLIRNQ